MKQASRTIRNICESCEGEREGEKVGRRFWDRRGELMKFNKSSEVFLRPCELPLLPATNTEENLWEAHKDEGRF